MRFFNRLPVQEKINFARHLAIVIKAGLPVLEGLRIIRKQTASKTLGKVIDQLIVDVNNGQFLADSLAKHRYLFGDFFISIIRVGETSGTLAANFLYLAEETEKAKDLRSKIRSALIYPVVILVATVGIVALLIFSVFPKVLPIFTSLRVKLPVTTRILIAVSQFLLAHGIETLLGLIALTVLFRVLFVRVAPFRLFFDRLLFFVPVVSDLIVSISMANFTRILGILLKSGIKIVEAVLVTSETFSNLAYRRAFIAAAEEVRRGEQFAHYLSSQKRIFPPLLAGLIEIGENTGNLEENLLYLSDYYVKRSETVVRNLTTILEPFLLLIMGLIVGFVALSIITPIYEVTSALRS